MRFTTGKEVSDGLDETDSETLLEFADEAVDHLEIIEQKLLAPGRGRHRPSAFAPALRSLHSLKGSAGYVGLGDIQELCHQSEEILGRIIRSSAKDAQSRIDLVLDVIPVIRERLAEVRRCCHAKRGVPRTHAAAEKALATLQVALGKAR